MGSENIGDLMLKTLTLKHDDHDDHDLADNDETTSDVVIAKATAMVGLFIASLFFGLLPFKLSQWLKWSETTSTQSNRNTGLIISILLCFGGGVLISTTFLHLLPEVAENIATLQESDKLPEMDFHFAELLMCLGFFTMYFVEEIVHIYLRRHEKRHKNAMINDHLDAGSVAEEAFRRGITRESIILSGRKKTSEIRNGSISAADLITNDIEDQKHNDDDQQLSTSSLENVTSNGNCKKIQVISASPPPPQPQRTGLDQIHNNIPAGHSHLHGHSHMMPTSNNTKSIEDDLIVSSLRGLLVVLALSVHELFEGLAVGLESSSSNVWYMFGAVSAHKLVLAFCVGVELVVTRTKLWLAFIYVLTFAAVSPMGIGIGILVSGSSEENTDFASVPSVILQGLASGTLLYVIFFEILSKDRSGLLQYAAVLVGFFIMFGLQFLTGHQHTHSHDHGSEDSQKGSFISNSIHNSHHHYEHDNPYDITEANIEEKLTLLREARDQIKIALVGKLK